MFIKVERGMFMLLYFNIQIYEFIQPHINQVNNKQFTTVI